MSQREKSGLDEALARSGEGAFVITADGRIVLWNHAAEKILGYSAREAVGRPCRDFFVGRDESGNRLCYKGCHVMALVKMGDPVLEIAGPLDMAVVLLRVVQPVPPMVIEGSRHVVAEAVEARRIDAEEYLAALAVELRKNGVRVEARVHRGVPAAEILAAARETEADLIVMTTHGRSGLGRLLFGSVAEEVLRHRTSRSPSCAAPRPRPPRAPRGRLSHDRDRPALDRGDPPRAPDQGRGAASLPLR